MKKIKISVIIPVYNAEKYLKKMLECLKSQTFKDFEIIAVNDGSTDNSLQVLEDFKKDFDHLIIINQNNMGSYMARINGIKKSNGKYIIILDSDDKLEETMLEELYNFSENNNVDISICGFNRVEFESNKLVSTEMCNHKKNIINVNDEPEQLIQINTSLWNKLFKKEIIEDIYSFKVIPYALDDMCFLTMIFLRTNTIGFINKPLYNYYVHEKSVITSINEKKILKVKETLLEIKEQYNIRGASQERKEVLSAMVFLHLNISMLYRIYESDAKKDFKRIKNDLDNYIDKNFAYYKSTKYLKLYYSILHKFSNIKIVIMKIIYQMKLYMIFLKFYSFIISKLKMDIKW